VFGRDVIVDAELLSQRLRAVLGERNRLVMQQLALGDELAREREGSEDRRGERKRKADAEKPRLPWAPDIFLFR